MKKKDIIIIIAALMMALALYAVSQMSLSGAASVIVVTVDGEVAMRRPLAMTDSYVIEQEDGARNVIRVEDGAVYMLEANCRDGLCIRQGKMKNAAKTIVCLPHNLVIRLEGEAISNDHDDLDVIIQ